MLAGRLEGMSGMPQQLVRRDVSASLDGLELQAVLYDVDDPTVSYISALGPAGEVSLRVSSRPYSSWPLVELLDELGQADELSDQTMAASVQRFARHDMTRLAPPPEPAHLDLASRPMFSWPIERPTFDDAAPAPVQWAQSVAPQIEDLSF
jgi:hypothetical protein